jgi:hypothetical protein
MDVAVFVGERGAKPVLKYGALSASEIRTVGRSPGGTCKKWPPRRSCSMSFRYWAEMAWPSSFFIFAATSFWLSPAALRASEMIVPKVFMISTLIIIR